MAATGILSRVRNKSNFTSAQGMATFLPVKRLARIAFLTAALAAVVTAGLYIYSLYPAFAGNDSPETVSASFNLWMEHAPGYPLHAMLGKISTLIPVGNNAFRVNLLSALLSCFTVFLFVIMYAGNDIKGRLAGFFGGFILAFSPTFFSQGIEAKGGIYILNILLILVMLYSFSCLINSKKTYLLFYLFGLSAAGSYMISAVMFPAVVYAAVKNRSRIFPAVLFFVVGITPYIYLIIRGPLQPPPRWADMSAISGFMFLVLRQGYPAVPELNTGNIIFQTMQAAKGFFENFSFILFFAVPGAVYLYKKERVFFLALLSCAVMDLLLTVFFNAVPQNAPWFVTIYLLPAYLVTVVFITKGMEWGLRSLSGRKSAVIIALVPVIFIFSNADKNDASMDFTAYDFGSNLMKTMDKDSLYLTRGDYFSMPFYYECFATREKSTVKNCDLSSLSYPFGLNDLYRLTGLKLADAGGLKYNMQKLGSSTIFTNLYSGAAAAYYLDAEKWEPYGLLFKYGPKTGTGNRLFYLYSYRGMEQRFKYCRDFEAPIISVYPAAMERALSAGGKSMKKSMEHDIADMEEAFYK
jgi:hypothetical protein